jgi:cytosolic iron-sulfur protein assembly protein CIAO1
VNSGDHSPPWKQLQTLTDAHTRTIFSVDWSKSHGTVASGGADDSICLSHRSQTTADGKSSATNTGDFVIAARVEHAHKGDVNCVKWHPTNPNLLASAGDDFLVKIWRRSTT